MNASSPSRWNNDLRRVLGGTTPASSAKPGRSVLWRLLCGLAAAAAVASCTLPQPQPDLTRYYVLTPVPSHPESKVAGTAEGPRVYLRPVGVPEFLRGRVMAVTLGRNEIRYVDAARWAEPIDAGLTRVLREDLARRSGVQAVLRPTDDHEYEIVLQVRQCDGVLAAHAARLAARIEILSAGLEPKPVAEDEFQVDIAGWDGRDFDQLAGKLSEAVARLSDRLAALLPRKNP